MSLAGFPGGARTYLLVLLVPALLCLVDRPRPAGGGHRRSRRARRPSRPATSRDRQRRRRLSAPSPTAPGWPPRAPSCSWRRRCPARADAPRPSPSGGGRLRSRAAAVAASLGPCWPASGTASASTSRPASPRSSTTVGFAAGALAGLGVTGWLEAAVPAPPGGDAGRLRPGRGRLPLHPGRHRPVDPGLHLHRDPGRRRHRPQRRGRPGRPARPRLHRLLRRRAPTSRRWCRGRG